MSPLSGVFPIAPTTFHDDETLDLDSQRNVVEFLVDAGVDGICVLANYSEQFSLTDAERDTLLAKMLHWVGGRVPVIVTTSHYSARVAAMRSRQAEEHGAAMVMLMPPYHGATLRVPAAKQADYFATVAEAVDIPIMVQDAPMSGTELTAAELAGLAVEVPQIQYVKVESPGTAAKLRELVQLAGDALPGPFDGEESITLVPDLQAGARGTMPSSMVPDVLGDVVRGYLAGDVAAAVARWEEHLPLIHYENRQCGLRATKVLMKEGGIIASEATRAPFGPLPAATRAGLVELARRHDPLVLRWS
ncbi:MAG: dihydrodipicolinate synthase family protein [Streptosporangiales bacterium]|nr:dihydrodipicolinate synthase family protein [Streptosporangiales bacterium]